MIPSLRPLALAATLLAAPVLCPAQFLDQFDQPKIDGWFSMTGDGFASAEFVPSAGYAAFRVDATRDHYGVWWALIKRDVAPAIDVAKLAEPAYELRVEARVRSSHAPRRVNFMLNTQRTTDFHEHLREYDLPDTGWHTISMTTRNFDARPGDNVYVQLCATDFGLDRYEVDVDYYRADVVRADQAGPDLGEPLMYHPAIPDLAGFTVHQPVTHDSLIHSDFPDVNFNDWQAVGAAGPVRVLTVDPHQWPVLRWDFTVLPSRTALGAGVLELTTFNAPQGGNYIAPWGRDFGEEFGRLHIVEILGGDPAWDQQTVTYNSLLRSGDPQQVFNGQMIQDVDIACAPGGKTYVVLPRPVLQRLLDGTTKGIVLRPLGAVNPSFYASEDTTPGVAPTLHFSVRPN